MKQALTVSVPGGPTGAVFTGIAGNFLIGTTATTTLAPSNFVFATEAGQILAWRGGSTAALATPADGGPDAIYKGLALATPAGGGPLLYATDFHNGRVDVFDGAWANVTPAGAFVDPRLPKRLRPVRDPDDRLEHLRHLREAGRRRRGRDRQAGPRDRRRVRPAGQPRRAGRAARSARRAVGPRDGARDVRPLRRRPARRQLRRRPDQRVQPEQEGRLAPRRHPAPDRRAEARDRRVVGARVRQRRLERRPEHALLRGRARRRVERALREDHDRRRDPGSDTPPPRPSRGRLGGGRARRAVAVSSGPWRFRRLSGRRSAPRSPPTRSSRSPSSSARTSATRSPATARCPSSSCCPRPRRRSPRS